jgi:hypothetical protein
VTAGAAPGDPLRSHGLTAAERKRVIEASREGWPFLAWRGGDGDLRVEVLDGDRARTLGRRAGVDVLIDDARVSGLHARLECYAGEWSVVDDGLSRNGTYVNEALLMGRRRLSDRDLVRLGRTILAFRTPDARRYAPTLPSDDPAVRPHLTAQQRSVLVELCRPLLADSRARLPATNDQIAAALHLSVGAVKMHLRTLYAKFKLEDARQNEKRLRLASDAIAGGAVGRHDVALGSLSPRR